MAVQSLVYHLRRRCYASALALGFSLWAQAGPLANTDPGFIDGGSELSVTLRKPEDSKPQGDIKGLTGDLVYKLLVGELAGQRGQLDTAVETYLDLARQALDAQLAERATRIALYAKKDDKALAAARLWVEQDPKNLEGRQALGLLLTRKHDTPAAVREFEYVLRSNDGATPDKLRAIATLLSRESDDASALEVMEALLVNRQAVPEATLAYAMLALHHGRIGEARDRLERALKRNPALPALASAYVGVLLKQDQGDKALEWLGQAVRTNPQAMELRMLYARMLADLKQYARALTEFEVVARKNPRNHEIWYALGLLYIQLERYGPAEKTFLRLSKEGNRSDEARYYLGQLADRREQWDQALRYYRSVSEGEQFFDAQLHIASTLTRQGHADDALEHLTTVPAEGPEQELRTILARGQILTDRKRYPEAMVLYNEAIGRAYKMELLYSRAMLAERQGDLKQMESDLRKIIEHEPANAQALNALGFTLADRTTRYAEAHELISKALKEKPSDYYILDSMGWVLYRLGRLPESLEYLNKARVVQKDPEIDAHIAEVLWAMGRKDESQQTLRRALKQYPKDAKLKTLFERLKQ